MKNTPYHLLFVDCDDECLNYMAKAITRNFAKCRGISDFFVSSSGFNVTSNKIDIYAVEVCKQYLNEVNRAEKPTEFDFTSAQFFDLIVILDNSLSVKLPKASNIVSITQISGITLVRPRNHNVNEYVDT
ncbi:MAG: hypothetical protein RRY18_06105, partial [Clostridia bacterium]